MQRGKTRGPCNASMEGKRGAELAAERSRAPGATGSSYRKDAVLRYLPEAAVQRADRRWGARGEHAAPSPRALQLLICNHSLNDCSLSHGRAMLPSAGSARAEALEHAGRSRCSGGKCQARPTDSGKGLNAEIARVMETCWDGGTARAHLAWLPTDPARGSPGYPTCSNTERSTGAQTSPGACAPKTLGAKGGEQGLAASVVLLCAVAP